MRMEIIIYIILNPIWVLVKLKHCLNISKILLFKTLKKVFVYYRLE